jgi:hypothetical protein
MFEELGTGPPLAVDEVLLEEALPDAGLKADEPQLPKAVWQPVEQ